MRYVDLDGVELEELAEEAYRYQRVLEAMQLGFITADNFNPEDRLTVQRVLAKAPQFGYVDLRRDIAQVTDYVDMMEGREWCFATIANGKFGVFSLDEPARTLILSSAVLHLWTPDGERLDFTSIPHYCSVAYEMNRGAGETAAA